MNTISKNLYYQIKPFIPRNVQIFARSAYTKNIRKKYKKAWPILQEAGETPEGWKGWPDKKRVALVLTHDVETIEGLNRCRELAEIEKEIGFRSSFNFVVGKYRVPDSIKDYLENNGFEIGIHGLYHDGKLFKSRDIFEKRAAVINRYLKKLNAVGFRAPSMHHNLEWIHELNVSYDLSTFDTDPFEPQTDGVNTIYPFWVKNGKSKYLEMPYTMVQDFTLFVLLKEKTNEIWKEKFKWIYKCGGMALVNTHPDYIAFNGEKPGYGKYSIELYSDFLKHIKSEYDGNYINILPKEMVIIYNNM